MTLLKWMRSHKPTSFLIALLLMTVPSAGLFSAANNTAVPWIWVGISLIILGNVIALLVK
ncbi:MAG: hypothetical protein JW908_09410 [Anaerolineales bacterium]|nr:hypothetical protein [Anaerolineales bacterium]